MKRNNMADSSEQQFINWTRLPSLCENSGVVPLVLVGLMAGNPASRQSDEILVDFDFF